MGSIQRLSSPEKMPGLQQSREARLCLSSRRPATAIVPPSTFRPNSLTVSLAKKIEPHRRIPTSERLQRAFSDVI